MRKAAVTLALAVALVLLPAPAAAASVTGRATWHYKTSPIDAFGYSYGGVNFKIPFGCWLTFAVRYNESSAGVAEANARTNCSGILMLYPRRFCNHRMTISYYDNDGRRYAFASSGVKTGCKTFVYYAQPFSVRGKYGKACARFYVDGKRRKTVCKSIHS